MDSLELKRIVRPHESERLEYKRTTGQRTDATRTVCAMLNGLGGYVFFGVSDEGTIDGQELGKRTIDELAQELRRIEPPVCPAIETVTLENGKSVIVVLVPGNPGGLYSFDGRAYLRHGSSTVTMPREEYQRRVLDLHHATRRWENEPVQEWVTEKDLDEDEVMLSVENAISRGRLELPRKRDLTTVLQGLGLIVNGRPINAAVALYARNRELESLFPQLGLRVARFRGLSRGDDFTDNRQYWGNAFSLLNEADAFLRDHVFIAGTVAPGRLHRDDRPTYPPRATREILANAFCHRDYTIAGGAVTVAMFDDRLEVANPGELHFGLTPEKLREPHASMPWNPIIAGVLYRAGVIERWGSGTLNVLDWCRENNNPPPTWTSQASTVVATLWPVPTADRHSSSPAKGPSQGPSQGTVETAKDKVLAMLSEKPLSSAEIARALEAQSRTGAMKRLLKRLVADGLIEQTNPEKPQSRLQKYRLTRKSLSPDK